MVALMEFLFITRLFSEVMASENELFYRNMALSLWVSLSTLFFTLFSFLHQFVFRSFKDVNSLKNSTTLSRENDSGTFSRENNSGTLGEDNLIDNSSLSEAEAQVPEEPDCGTQISVSSESDEKEKQDFVFKFRFQTYEEFSKTNEEKFNSVSLNSNTAASSLSNRYEFLPEKSTSHFMEEAQIPSFTVEVLNSYSNDDFLGNEEILGNGNLSIKELSEKVSESEPVDDQIPESFANNECKEEEKEEEEEEEDDDDDDDSENREGEQLAGDSDSQKRKLENSQTERENEHDTENENQFLTEKDFVAFDFDTDSTASSFEISIMSQLNGESGDGFLSDADFEDAGDVGTLGETDGKGANSREEDLDFGLNIGYEPDDFDDDDDEINEELKKIEELDTQNPGKFDSSCENSKENMVDSGKSESKDSFSWDSEDSNGLETQWEHQELIEQLKMELKKVRATGLPTILEESESPKIMADLKPWKIDEKYHHGDRMDELHKFYKSYRERMRKLDILNYQKMYAIGFLQSKDPLKSFSSISKSSSPSITSILSHNLRLYRQRKSQVDPMKNFMRELHCDLEMVYVGQMCLSWEFIQWQYEKALDLWESEPYGLHQYNEVAGEFQQFQVLLQRFIENEAFEGPRVENYIKNRCVARNLLQVPVIREDKQRDRRKARRGRDKDEAITSDMLVEILQESIRVIWKFIRADRDHNVANLKRPRKCQVELQDPADKQLLLEIQADLQKKEKKLKDIGRSGHCILKKLQRNEEDETESDVCFFSQVDMKLISRVLKMSRITTDQLVWCSNKLSRINFLNRKIHVEPSFFLFPC